MNSGWVPFSREWIGLIKNHTAWILWSWLLMKAQYQEYRAVIGGRVVDLKPGQLIFTFRNAAKDTGLSMRETRTGIKTLKNLEFLTHEATHAYSVITITNLDGCGGKKEETDTANDTPATHQRHINNNIKKKQTYVVHHAGERVPLEEGVQEVLSLLNQKRSEIIGNGVRPITATGELAARLRDHSVVDVCRVILTKAGDPHFIKNPRFFHPRTLFRKSLFETYLDDVEIVRVQRARGNQW